MARGGYRDPGNQGASGPGRFSKRTDGNDPRRSVPNVGDSDLEYGDRQKLEAGLRQAPLPRSEPVASPRGSSPRPAPAGGGPSLEAITNRPTDRPSEPITAGMDMGPGPGKEALGNREPQDDRELIYQYLASKGNPDARRQLRTYRRGAPTNIHTVTDPNKPAPAPMESEVPSVAEEELELAMFDEEEVEPEMTDEALAPQEEVEEVPEEAEVI